MVSFIEWKKLLSLWPTRDIWSYDGVLILNNVPFRWCWRPYRWSIIVSIYRSQSRAHSIDFKSLHICICVCESKCIAYVIKSSPLVMIINWFYKCRMCDALVRFCLLCIWLSALNCDSKIDCFTAFYRCTHLIYTCTCSCTHTHTHTHYPIILFHHCGIISVWWQNLLASIFAFISQYGNRFVHNGEITIKRYKWTIGDKCEHWTLQQPKSIPISGNYNRKLNIIISLISVLCLFFNRR